MAEIKYIAPQQESTADRLADIPEDEPPQILFKPFEYGDDAGKFVHGHQAIQLAKHARAVAWGTALLMQINERDAIELTSATPKPVFGEFHRGQLEALVWAAADMLGLEASKLIEEADKKLREGRETA